MSSWLSCDRALDLCKSNADRRRGGCFFWFVLNKRSIGDETALCPPNISHFDLAEIGPSIGFWYNAPPAWGSHNHMCTRSMSPRGAWRSCRCQKPTSPSRRWQETADRVPSTTVGCPV